nr:DsbA family protein [Niveibacterium umoris]
MHYVFDPFCGWCYAAAPLVRAARAVPGLQVVPHAGGMMAGAQRHYAIALRDYVVPHDRRIAAMTGQPFGDAYFEGLLRDPDAVFDSLPPTTALLAAAELGGDAAALDLLARLQTAHYVEGQRIAETAVLARLAMETGLDAAAFESAFARQLGAATQAHIAASRQMLALVGAQGFPTFILAGEGTLQRIDHSVFLGQPSGFAARLTALQGAVASPGAAGAGCADGACPVP